MPQVQATVPQVEQLPTGEYSITITDDEYGHGEQVFKAATLDGLCSKLGDSARHATAHIRELTRELRDVRADYAIARDVASLLTALLLVKHASADAPTRTLDKIIRSMTRELSERLPEPGS